MLALEAIYGADDFTRDADGRGFSLRVAAHEGAAMAMTAEEEEEEEEEASVSLRKAAAARQKKKASAATAAAAAANNNTSAALLCVRYPALYPSRPLKVTVKPLEGLPEAAARALQNQLSALAAEAAAEKKAAEEPQAAEKPAEKRERDEFDVSDAGGAAARRAAPTGGEVCAFSLATAAADFLGAAQLRVPSTATSVVAALGKLAPCGWAGRRLGDASRSEPPRQLCDLCAAGPWSRGDGAEVEVEADRGEIDAGGGEGKKEKSKEKLALRLCYPCSTVALGAPPAPAGASPVVPRAAARKMAQALFAGAGREGRGLWGKR